MRDSPKATRSSTQSRSARAPSLTRSKKEEESFYRRREKVNHANDDPLREGNGKNVQGRFDPNRLL